MVGTDDRLFGRIRAWQGDVPWGRVLDAGTGQHSLSWIMRLKTESWTAITGDMSRRATMRQTFAGRIRSGDRLVVGNWSDPGFLKGERFDVVLADYLIGALEGFSPYYQDQILGRLRPHVGGALYVVGMTPIPNRADSEGGGLIVEIARVRDACILLAGHRTYREYPLDWMVRNLERSGFAVERRERLPILYGTKFIRGQMSVARRKLPLFSDKELSRVMGRRLDALEARALAYVGRMGRISFGSDYIVKAVPV